MHYKLLYIFSDKRFNVFSFNPFLMTLPTVPFGQAGSPRSSPKREEVRGA
jgi:hypothetical protein